MGINDETTELMADLLRTISGTNNVFGTNEWRQ